MFLVEILGINDISMFVYDPSNTIIINLLMWGRTLKDEILIKSTQKSKLERGNRLTQRGEF